MESDEKFNISVVSFTSGHIVGTLGEATVIIRDTTSEYIYQYRTSLYVAMLNCISSLHMLIDSFFIINVLLKYSEIGHHFSRTISIIVNYLSHDYIATYVCSWPGKWLTNAVLKCFSVISAISCHCICV